MNFDIFNAILIAYRTSVKALMNFHEGFFLCVCVYFMSFAVTCSYNKFCMIWYNVAILSHDVKVNESFPFSISLAWKGSGPDAQDSGPDNQQSSLVFPKGNPIPSIKALTFYRSGTFSIDAQYSDVNGQQTPARISTYTVSHLTSLLVSLFSIFYHMEVLLPFWLYADRSFWSETKRKGKS